MSLLAKPWRGGEALAMGGGRRGRLGGEQVEADWEMTTRRYRCATAAALRRPSTSRLAWSLSGSAARMARRRAPTADRAGRAMCVQRKRVPVCERAPRWLRTELACGQRLRAGAGRALHLRGASSAAREKKKLPCALPGGLLLTPRPRPRRPRAPRPPRPSPRGSPSRRASSRG